MFYFTGEVVKIFLTLLFTLLALPAVASEGGTQIQNMTGSTMGIIALMLFVAAYSLVIFEEQIHLRKSKPVLLAAGIIWVLVAVSYNAAGMPDHAHNAIKHNLIEYAELFLFLLVAMTYINAMEERNVFQTLRCLLVSRGFSLRVIFWLTGVLSFVISPLADNLTTALLMG
ncbi:MAG: sodium:proton antiporter NhaD, partial [Desulfuromonadaceae bacterium]